MLVVEVNRMMIEAFLVRATIVFPIKISLMKEQFSSYVEVFQLPNNAQGVCSE